MTFLRSQGLVRLPMLVSIGNGALGLALCYFLTRPSALGFAGAPLSSAIIHIAQAAMLYVRTPRVLSTPTCKRRLIYSMPRQIWAHLTVVWLTTARDPLGPRGLEWLV